MDVIETSRLRLRLVTEKDIPGLVLGLNDWSVAQWLVRPPFPYCEQDARQFIEWSHTSDETGFSGKLVIADLSTDVLMGVISLEPADGAAELGYWILPASQRRGYLSEAAIALLREGAERLSNVSTAFATVDPENIASRRALERLGFQMVRQVRAIRSRRGTSSVLAYERTLGDFQRSISSLKDGII